MLGVGGIAVALLAAFVVIERRSIEPLVRLSIFRSAPSAPRTSRCSSSQQASSRCSSSIPSTCSECSAIRRSRPARFPPLYRRHHHRRRSLAGTRGQGRGEELLLIGMTMAIAGMLSFMRLQPDSDYVTDFLPGVMFASIGMGLTRAGHADRDQRRPGLRRRPRRASTTRRSRSAAHWASRSSLRSR